MQGVEEIQINGGDGNDIVTVYDLAGSDISGDTIVFAGGAGDDTLDASATGVPVEASGDAGNDSLTGGGATTLSGGTATTRSTVGPATTRCPAAAATTR